MKFVNFLSYIAIALIAIVLVFGKLLGWLINPSILAILNLIAQFIAYAITAVFAFYYAKSRKKSVWMILYVVFVILIILFTVLNNI